MTQTSQSLACRQVFGVGRSCESSDENTDLFSGFGCTRASLRVSGANIGRRVIPANHGRVGLGCGQRCMTPMLVRLSAASGHRFSIGVTSGLSRNRRLPVVVVDALALTMRRRWSRLLNAGKEDQVVIGALGFVNYIDDMLIIRVNRDSASRAWRMVLSGNRFR